MSDFQLGILRHFISGEALFTAILCLLLAVLWRSVRGPGGESVVWLLVLLGFSLLLLSSSFVNSGTAISVVVTIGWLLAGAPPRDTEPNGSHLKKRKTSELLLNLAVVLLWGFEGGLELVWRQAPDLTSITTDAPIVVLGDSLSAEDPETDGLPWPARLRETMNRPVRNLSQIGATVGSVLKALPDTLPPGSLPDHSLIVVELGGNDLLGTTTPTDFREQLDTLLRQLATDNATVVMFELPLPPFKSEFGRAQRELARKYRVKLIPKRVLSSVLLSPETTLDSLHLSPSGHERLARQIDSLLTP